MKSISLSGIWQIRSSCNTYQLEGQVPGTFFQALEESGYWGDKDVFWQENNRKCLEIANRDFTFSRDFHIEKEFLNNSQRITLDAGGLDTLTEISINGTVAGTTRNMHRRYVFDVTELIHAGNNEISITFFNTLEYVSKKQKERYVWSTTNNVVDGFNHIRKCSSSYGWDWGPIIPDLGIWRELKLCSISNGRLLDTQVRQEHQILDDGSRVVYLQLESELETVNSSELTLRYSVTAPDGTVHREGCSSGNSTKLIIENPQLWWPNGYGDQVLYGLKIELLHNNELLDTKKMSIGLRTIEIDQSPDEYGTRFGLCINGITIFSMGGNIIPQDVYTNRVSKESTENLLKQCKDANFNCLRIWGGGIYPDNDFYDTCDRLGLLVWQDLMFACALYNMRDIQLRDEIVHEVTDNLKRLSHHASLALVCGNNEMEWAFTDWPHMIRDKENRAEYAFQYEYLLPELVGDISPDISYWKASPSSGGFFDNPNDSDRGDVHYWDVWHGDKPFTDFRKHYFRFLSEYGFQSFPSFKTVCSYTEESDRNPYSPVMEDHQRNGDMQLGNQKIMKYTAEYFRLGKDMSSHCYLTHLCQAEAGRFAVEHLRQNRGRCLGSTYWQVNDNWPVASWSSIDYYGRWKALHYAMKRAYAPVLVSCREVGHAVDIFVTTEGQAGFSGFLELQLKGLDGQIYLEQTLDVEVGERTAQCVMHLDFSKELTENRDRERYLSVTLKDRESYIVRRASLWFVRYKKISLPEPGIRYDIYDRGEYWDIQLTAERYACFVELDMKEGDAIFEDNYFDLDAEERRVITLQKERCKGDPIHALTVRSLYDSYQ
jgi:beta-mannosidase